MASSGGSATLYGVLYQILRSLSWVKELRLEGNKNSGESVTVQIVLEPLDGGDLQIASPKIRVVEQCKSRRMDRPRSGPFTGATSAHQPPSASGSTLEARLIVKRPIFARVIASS